MQDTDNPAGVNYVTPDLFIYLSMKKLRWKAIVK